MRRVSWCLERDCGGLSSDSDSDIDTDTIRMITWFRRRVHNMGGEQVGQSERRDCCWLHRGSLDDAADGTFYLFRRLRSVGIPPTDHMLADVLHFLLSSARGMRCAVCDAGGGGVCRSCGAVPTFLLDVKEDVYPEDIWEEPEPEPVVVRTECWTMYAACDLERVSTEGEQSAEQCSICLEEFGVGAEARRMPCSHLFHSRCIDPWLSRSNVCPLCRFRLPGHSVWSSQSFLH